MSRYWCRFYALTEEMPSFEYHGPWWRSGTTMDDDEQTIVCCAVVAESEDAAESAIRSCFDPGHGLCQWDGATKRPDTWEPFTERFPRAAWMRWPTVVDAMHPRGAEVRRG